MDVFLILGYCIAALFAPAPAREAPAVGAPVTVERRVDFFAVDGTRTGYALARDNRVDLFAVDGRRVGVGR
jgi:hypothetical protein